MESGSTQQVHFQLELSLAQYSPSLFDYFDNLIPGIVLPLSQLPDIAQKTTYTQNVHMDVTFHLRYVIGSSV